MLPNEIPARPVSPTHNLLMRHGHEIISHLVDSGPYGSILKLLEEQFDVHFGPSCLNLRILFLPDDTRLLLPLLHSHVLVMIETAALLLHFLGIGFVLLTVTHLVYFLFAVVLLPFGWIL